MESVFSQQCAAAPLALLCELCESCFQERQAVFRGVFFLQRSAGGLQIVNIFLLLFDHDEKLKARREDSLGALSERVGRSLLCF